MEAATVETVAPHGEPVGALELAQSLTGPTWEPFDDVILDFCAQLSRRISRTARGVPELQALAFWMRRAELTRLRNEFAHLPGPRELLVPRGLAFHVPPANVDTIFIYSWLMSALVGNANVVRYPSRVGPQAGVVVDVLNDLLAMPEFGDVAARTAFVRYGHDAAVTDALSQACDVRVIWGGDATIATIRRSPLPAHATELTFPDRLSFAVISVNAYVALDDGARNRLVEQFFNDSYWFDQMGCSSPRILFWVGREEVGREAGVDFFSRLQATKSSRGYVVDTATALSKISYAHRAVIDRPVTTVEALDNEVTVLTLATPAGATGDFSGAGTFLQTRCYELSALAPLIERRDQTMTHFGFSDDDLRGFARILNGRGVDRIVPFGEALTFNRFWDGHDLLQAFTRRVYVEGGRAR